MHDQPAADAPSSPPTQPADVREELDQENIDKTGEPRTAADAGPQPDSHFGAVEDTSTGASDQYTVTPPMEGPAKVTGGSDDDSLDIDPHQEIPGGG